MAVKKGLAIVARSLAVLVLWLATAMLGLALHANTPAARNAVRQLLNDALAGVFQGTIEVGPLTQLSTGDINAEYVRLRVPDTVALIVLEEVHAEARVIDLAWQLITAERPLTIVIDRLHVARATTHWRVQVDNKISVIEAFRWRRPAGGETPVRVWLPQISVDRWLHTLEKPGLPPARVELENAHGTVLSEEHGTVVELTHLNLHGTLGAHRTAGELNATLRFPGESDGTFNGQFAGIPIRAHLHKYATEIELEAVTQSASAARLRALWDGYPLVVPLAARVSLRGRWPKLNAEAEFRAAHSSLEADGQLDFTATPKGRLNFSGSEFDLAIFSESISPTALQFDGSLDFDRDSGQWAFDYRLDVEPTTLGELSIPQLNVQGSLADGELNG